ncbi:uncharacterized protein [Musca autumnalis]|uniref:uncharacterized protein n=1 Tax=Musca autumnalis TaxID=221902 RepID=UPI003CECCAC4
MVDVAALAAFTIYNEIMPIKRSDRRRSFLLLLTKQLATPNIEERALNNNITSYPRIRNAMEAFDVRYYQDRWKSMHRRLRLGQVDRHVAFTVLSMAAAENAGILPRLRQRCLRRT